MTVTIYGYRESFACSPVVKVYQNGQLLAEVPPKDKVEIDGIEKNSVLVFKCMFRSDRCVVSKPNILLSFNRMTGRLRAISSEDVEQGMKMNAEMDSNNILITVIIIIIFLIIFFALL